MLLIGRGLNESVVIGNDIEVKVVRIEESVVCLAIQAPRPIPIHRKEIFSQIKSAMKNNGSSKN
ncbi:hypothetical protein AYO45_01925 [Gammaproteobacteria bacterium SCGC AG-212-F23]|nr:hypothetical protein AYO45_01925 [Gammaproteobacteria bacterium SCGC AG-212-F23]